MDAQSPKGNGGNQIAPRAAHFNRQHQSLTGYSSARARKLIKRKYPPRVQYDLRSAARRLHLRVIGCQVEIWNPYATGKRGYSTGAPQWIDLIAKHPSLGLLAIDINPDPRYGNKFATEKERGLAERGIPYLCMEPGGLWELEANMAVWIRKLTMNSKKEKEE